MDDSSFGLMVAAAAAIMGGAVLYVATRGGGKAEVKVDFLKSVLQHYIRLPYSS